MTALYDQLQAAAAFVRKAVGPRRPTVGLILGSGLGAFAETLTDAVAIEYADIPHFPVARVEGHAGRLVVGTKSGVTCCALQGRVHYYEGHSMERVVFPARTLVLLGCKTLIVTNAAGAVNAAYTPGILVFLSDHINLMGESPLRGENDERLGPRFPDMTRAYPRELRHLARRAAQKAKIPVEEGVYAAMPGPNYESPAEVRMIRTLGADLAGMSTVPEVIAATHMGARVLGISCATNMAAGLTGDALSHEEVTETAGRVREQFARLLDAILAELSQEGSR